MAVRESRSHMMHEFKACRAPASSYLPIFRIIRIPMYFVLETIRKGQLQGQKAHSMELVFVHAESNPFLPARISAKSHTPVCAPTLKFENSNLQH